MNESAYYRKLRKRLIAEGAVVIKWFGSGMGQNGVPDLYISSRTWRGWLELKVGKNDLSDLQRKMVGDLLFSGDRAGVLRGPDHIIENVYGVECGRLDWKLNLLHQLAIILP